jgi:hypothetical protein
MAKRKRGNKLERWEVGLIKAIVADINRAGVKAGPRQGNS